MIALWLTACGAPPPPPEPRAPSRGVEPVTAEQLRARMFAPAERTRVVNFWATWCQPCLAELPHLRALAQDHPEVEVVMVSLDLPKLRQSKVEPFVEAQGLSGFTHLQLDEPDALSALPKVVPGWPDILPLTLVIDPSGTEVRRHPGALGAEDARQLVP